ncbi:MAG: FtsX-like permease family protein, partial [Bryobacteraceae bacterium]
MLPLMLNKFPMAPGISLKMFQEAKFGPSIHPLKEDVVGDIGKVLWILMATVGIVLLIACANVANLLLVRAEGRQQELAIRAALGAGWRQIARELLMESVTLGIAGGLLGLAVAYAALRALIAIGPANLPRLDDISIDSPVLLFTLAISLVAGFLFGLIPAVKYAGPHLATTLREGGRSISEGRERHRARSALVIVQVALALVLLVGSGLMIRTLRALREIQPGFASPETLQILHLSIPEAQVKDPLAVVRMDQDIQGKIAAVPGVTSVAIGNSVPIEGYTENDPVFREDQPNTGDRLPPLRRYRYIAPGYFHTMGTPLLAGRDLGWTDTYEKRPVVLISGNLAREWWGSPTAALGKLVRENNKGVWREIVGVVGDVRDNGVNQKSPTMIYLPILLANFWGQPIQLQRTVA